MFKILLYSALLLVITLFLSSCASSNHTSSGKSTEHYVTEDKSSDDVLPEDSSYESYKWTPPLFTQNELQPEKKPYEDLFNFGFPTSLNISNVPPTSPVPYAIVDDPNRGRLYITDFPIKNEENSFTIGK